MSKQKQEGQEQPKLHPVTLLRDHEHGGQMRRASETIEVTEPERNWLRAQRVIADVATTEV